MGRSFPEGKTFFERECPSIANLLATDERDVTAKNARGHAKQYDRLAQV